MSTIGIAGGAGFVGRHITSLLVSKGYKVIIFTRNPVKTDTQNVSYAVLDVEKGKCDEDAIGKVNVIINLAGAGIADKRWTAARKKEIVDSRVKGTNFLVNQLKQHAPGCKTFLAASAMGFYGPDSRGGIPFTETNPPYNDFLGEACREWEEESHKAAEFTRTVIFRFGIVLGKESGAFPKFVQPLSFGIMPVLGSGRQVVSWIAVIDLARLFLFALEQSSMSGIYNAVTPNPVTQRELMKTIALVKGGLAIPAPVPALVLKIVLGEMSIEVLKSCTVSAQKTLNAGFTFSHPGIESAVKAILGK